MNGLIDDVRIYSRALSATEIAALAAGNHTTAVWDGSNSTDWETAANWDIGAVPDPFTHVIVRQAGSGSSVLAASVSGASLTIEASSSLDLSGFNFELNDGGALKGGGTLKLKGSEVLSNLGNLATTSTGTVLYYGTGSFTGLAAGNNYNNLTINDGLVGYWKMDEGTGTLAADSSGHGNHGTLTSGPTWSADPTNNISFTNPYALSFDGSNDYVDITSSGLTPIVNRTYTLWFFPTINTESTMLGGDEGGDGNIVRVQGGNLDFHNAGTWFVDLNGTTLTSSGNTGVPVLMNQWNFLALRQTVTTTWTNLYFGKAKNNRFFGGLLDDVRIYNRALSTGEVAALAAGNQPSTTRGTFTLDAALDVNGDLVLNGGTLDPASSNYAVTVGGSWINNGGVFTPRKGTVTLDGTTSGLKILSGGQRFDKLTINGAGSTYTLADHLTASGTLALTNGTLDASTGNFTVRAGTINQTSGIFTPRSGTVILTSSADATATITSTLNTLRIEDSSENGLVGYWKFDEGTNTGAILDSSGYGNTGVRRGGAGKIWSGSSLPSLQFENRSAMQFDGTDDYVEVGDSASLRVESAPFTVSVWIRPSTVRTQIIFFKSTASFSGNGWGLIMNRFGNDISLTKMGIADQQVSYTFSTNTWFYVVAVQGATSVEYFVNGSSIGSFSNATAYQSSSTYPLRIGGGNTFMSQFHGLLDDVRIYGRALSANEVANLARGRYAAGNSSTSTFTLGANLSTTSLALDSGNLSTSTRTLTVTNALTMLRGGGNLTLGSALTTLNGGLVLSGSTITGGAGTLDVNGAVQILTGSLIAPSGTLTVSGNWNKTGGTFTHNSGTVEFDEVGAQTLSGSLAFYNLTNIIPGGRFFLSWNGQVSVSGALVLRGTLGNVLKIRSTRSGSAATLNLDTDGTQTLDYLDVQDNDASGGTALFCLTGCLNSGNTTNWQLANTSVSFQSGSLTISETSGTATLTINLSGATLRTITIPFTITGTATGTGSDFTVLTPSPLIIEAGETATGIIIRFINDSTVESNETIILTLGTPTNASVGTTGALTVTLTSDDVAPSAGDGGPSTWLLNLRRENNLSIGGQPSGGSGGGGTPSGGGITSFVPNYEPLAQAMKDAQERARRSIDPVTLDPRRIPAIRDALIARFQLLKAEEQQIIAEDDRRTAEQQRLTDRHRQQQLRERQELALEQAAQAREKRIAERIATHEATIVRLAREQESLQKQYAQRREERLRIALEKQEEVLEREQLALQKEQDALRAEQEQNAREREQRIAERKAEEEERTRQLALSPTLILTPTLTPTPTLQVIAARRGRLFAIVDDQPVMFSDVSTDEWYAPFVSYVLGEKIAQGYKDAAGNPKGEFGVANPVTIAEVVKMALEASGSEINPSGVPRNRSAVGTWASAYVAAAEALNLSVYGPARDVHTPATRGEVIQTILEVMGFPIPKTPSSFADVPSTHPYTQAIGLAAYSGFVEGDKGPDGSPLNRFRPDDHINRAEIAKIIALVREVLR